jgi:hypothetical protein
MLQNAEFVAILYNDDIGIAGTLLIWMPHIFNVDFIQRTVVAGGAGMIPTQNKDNIFFIFSKHIFYLYQTMIKFVKCPLRKRATIDSK